MTKAEVETLIQEELRRAMGSRAGLLNLRETDSQRVAREQRVKEAEQRAKTQRKDEKRVLKEGARAFRDLGMSKKEARAAAQGRPQFRG